MYYFMDYCISVLRCIRSLYLRHLDFSLLYLFWISCFIYLPLCSILDVIEYVSAMSPPFGEYKLLVLYY
ncbi:hypothetical protein M6B38_329850 [Iris pallida]|uniref:Uncharacterized protein n=1 Tax=Iris pallida TaxID=29817 RepID=A0AAX6H5K3_IRIPA|nr:hypothetical protein M6B38_329850 [Iris pallida]